MKQDPQLGSPRNYQVDPPRAPIWIHQDPSSESTGKGIHQHPPAGSIRIYHGDPSGCTTGIYQDPKNTSLEFTRIQYWDPQGSTTWIYPGSTTWICQNKPCGATCSHPLDPAESMTEINQVVWKHMKFVYMKCSK